MFEAQLLEPESIIAVDPGDLILLQGKVRHPPLFPIIAPLVSSFSMATRVSLRIASLSVEAVFDSFKYSALASLGLGRRTLVSAINSARTLHFLTFGGSKGEKESDTYFLKVLDQYTDQGVYFAHTVFSLAELLSLTTFHLYSSTIRFSIRVFMINNRWQKT